MLKLFNDYKNAGKIAEALLTGRNMFNREPQNEEIFTTYFEYLCKLAETLPSLTDRQSFAEQANVALAFFTENAELTEKTVNDIVVYQQRLNSILDEIKKMNDEKLSAEKLRIESYNSECLKKLYNLKDLLQRTSSQKEFDDVLVQISQVDSEIDKDTFNDAQNRIYDNLTKEHTELISIKMRELEHKRNIIYNKEAADSFAKAFKQFRTDESKYKNQTQLFSLVSSTLFAYDASRLFNETLIYYNHVYSYIFSKLDDDGKLALTRYSIECERKLR